MQKWAKEGFSSYQGWTGSTLLGEFASLLSALYDDLRPFSSEEKASLAQWSAYVKALAQAYFHADEESFNRFFSLCDRLNYAEKKREEKYSASFVLAALRSLLFESSFSMGSQQVQTLQFCSLIPMRAIPARAIILLGMNESVFPRKEKFRSLDLLRNHLVACHCPAKGELDRYLFLETLLSARDYLIISALKNDPQQKQEEEFSGPVHELLRFLPHKIVVDHPEQSFDLRYFNGENLHLKNFSSKDFRAAQVLAGERVKVDQEETSVEKKSEEVSPYLDIKHLFRWIKNPLGFYLDRSLGLQIEKKEEREEEFTLSHLDLFKQRQNWVKGDKSEKSYSFMNPLFASVAAKRVEEQEKNLETLFSHQAFQSSFTLELHPHYKALQIEDKKWFTAPLEVKLAQPLTLIGKIEGVTSQGILLNEKSDWKGATRALPVLLLCQILSKRDAWPWECSKVIFLKDGKEKEIVLAHPQNTLEKLLSYYQQSAKKAFLSLS